MLVHCALAWPCILAGLTLLQYRTRLPRGIRVCALVLLLMAAVILWSPGGALGALLWLFLSGLTGFALALQQGLRADKKKARRKRQGRELQVSTVSVVRLRRLLPMLVATLLLSLAGLAVIALWLPVEVIDRALLALLLWPLIWCAALLYLYASSRRVWAWLMTGLGVLAGLGAAVAGWMA